MHYFAFFDVFGIIYPSAHNSQILNLPQKKVFIFPKIFQSKLTSSLTHEMRVITELPKNKPALINKCIAISLLLGFNRMVFLFTAVILKGLHKYNRLTAAES